MKNDNATFVVCGAVALSSMSGCAKKKESFTGSRSRTNVEESSFSAGAGRSPTPRTTYAFARVLVDQGRDRDALYVLSRLVRDHANFLPAYNEMANIYVRADRLDDAIAILHKGLEQSPSDGVLQNNLGM